MGAQKEITISGVGGQGMILCGTMIAKAAAIHDHKRATLTSEYGTETRGTFAKSDVIVSDEEIFFPDVTEPDLIICLHNIAYARYSGKQDDKAVIIYNSDTVDPDPAQAAHEIGVPITKMAKEVGNPATANIITMGIIIGYTGAVSPEGAKDAIADFFSAKGEKITNLNLKAFDMGYEKGLALK